MGVETVIGPRRSRLQQLNSSAALWCRLGYPDGRRLSGELTWSGVGRLPLVELLITESVAEATLAATGARWHS